MPDWLRNLLGGGAPRAGLETRTILHVGPRGYTRLTEDDPGQALEEILRMERLVEQAARDHGGSVVQAFNGDCWAAFATAPAALRAAHEVSRAVRAASLPLRLAFAIHTGPVMIHGGRYYGSPLNTAAQIGAFGPGQGSEIVLSAPAAALVERHLPEGTRLARLEPLAAKGGAPLELFGLTQAAPLAAFISYRRGGGAETARLVCEDLQRRGVKTFLDLDDLGSHHFDARLCREIEAARNFVLILSPGCLERCRDEADWLRREIAHALKCGRNIIPVATHGFSFPSAAELPSELAELPRHNAVAYSHEYFRPTMDKIAGFLVEDPAPPAGRA